MSFTADKLTPFKIKVKLAKLLNRTRLPETIIARSQWKIILAFHRIVSLSKACELGLHPSLYVTPETFKAVLYSLQSIGQFVDLVTFLSSNPEGPLFTVTFDDGWIDTYTNAYPVLKDMNVPFAVFVATSLIENGTMNWTEEIVAQFTNTVRTQPEKALEALRYFDSLYKSTKKDIDIFSIVNALKLLPYEVRNKYIDAFYAKLGVRNAIRNEMLTWNHLEEFKKDGMLIGSHTHSHIILKGASAKQIANELTVSKTIIKKRLDYDTQLFCYPNGLYDRTNEAILKSTGYSYGFITDDRKVSKNISPFFVPRFLVYEDIVPILYLRFITNHK